jgi:hypothetical protein
VPGAVAEPDPFNGRLGQPAALGGPPAPVQQAVGDVVRVELLHQGLREPVPD